MRMMKSTDQKKRRACWHNILFFYQAIFSGSSLENVTLCSTTSSCPLNLYGFSQLPWPTTPRKKVSAHRGKSTVSSKSELVCIVTSVKLSFSQPHPCIHPHTGVRTHTHTHARTPHMYFALLLSKSRLNSLLCQRIILLAGLRWGGDHRCPCLTVNQPGKPQWCCLNAPCRVTVIVSGEH